MVNIKLHFEGICYLCATIKPWKIRVTARIIRDIQGVAYICMCRRVSCISKLEGDNKLFDAIFEKALYIDLCKVVLKFKEDKYTGTRCIPWQPISL